MCDDEEYDDEEYGDGGSDYSESNEEDYDLSPTYSNDSYGYDRSPTYSYGYDRSFSSPSYYPSDSSESYNTSTDYSASENTLDFSDASGDYVDPVEAFGMEPDLYDQLMAIREREHNPEEPFPPPEAFTYDANPRESIRIWLWLGQAGAAGLNDRIRDEPQQGPSRVRNVPPFKRKETWEDYVYRKRKDRKDWKASLPPGPEVGGGFGDGERERNSPPQNDEPVGCLRIAPLPENGEEFRAGLMGEKLSRKRKRHPGNSPKTKGKRKAQFPRNPYEGKSPNTIAAMQNEKREIARANRRPPPVLDLVTEDVASGAAAVRRNLRFGQNTPSPPRPPSPQPGCSRARTAIPVSEPLLRGPERPKPPRRTVGKARNRALESFHKPPTVPRQPTDTPLRTPWQGQVFSSPESMPPEEMETVEVPDYVNWNPGMSTPKDKLWRAKDPAKRVPRSPPGSSPDPFERPQGKKKGTRRKLKKTFKKARFSKKATLSRRRRRAFEHRRRVRRGENPSPLKHTPSPCRRANDDY